MSISAPRMSIRTYVLWPIRALIAMILLGTSVALGLWAYETGKRFTGRGQGGMGADIKQLQEQVQNLTHERDELIESGHQVDSRLEMERSTQAQLLAQTKLLEKENAKLKEDLSFFETLSGSGINAGGISIKRFVIEPEQNPHRMRYRILLAQGGRVSKDFIGEMQLILTLQQEGKTVIVTLPSLGPDTSGIENASVSDPKSSQINLRFFKRFEGQFNIPERAQLKEAQLRILEHGVIRAQQVIALK